MIIEITASAIGGGIVGFLGCAFLTAGKLANLGMDLADAEANAAASLATYNRMFKARSEAVSAHTRLADLAATKQARIDRALEQVTPGANATVQRIARILKGEAA